MEVVPTAENSHDWAEVGACDVDEGRLHKKTKVEHLDADTLCNEIEQAQAKDLPGLLAQLCENLPKRVGWPVTTSRIAFKVHGS